jgi:hypothetical protein
MELPGDVTRSCKEILATAEEQAWKAASNDVIFDADGA